VREFSSVPIIFLTSLNSQKDIEKGFFTGADDYIQTILFKRAIFEN